LAKGGHVVLIRHCAARLRRWSPGLQNRRLQDATELGRTRARRSQGPWRGLPQPRRPSRPNPVLALVPLPGNGSPDGCRSGWDVVGPRSWYAAERLCAARRVEKDCGRLARARRARARQHGSGFVRITGSQARRDG